MLLSGCAGILTRVTDGESEVLSLLDIKGHLRDDEDAANDVLLLLITAVRQATEEYLDQSLITSTWTLELDRFPTPSGDFSLHSHPHHRVIREGRIDLPMGPVVSIQTVEYFDTDDVLQTLAAANYEFDRNGRLRPVSTKVWPGTFDRLNAVKVSYTAGQADGGQVPEDIKLAMKLMIGKFDVGREDIVIGTIIAKLPDGYKYLLNAHRVHRI